MKFKTLKYRLFFSLLFFNLTLLGQSKIDELMERNDIKTLKELIKNTKIIDNENELPIKVEENSLIIIDNEYEVKSLFEFHDGQWNDKVNKTISKLLENHQGTTYGNLFNYKVNAKEFTPYESDNFKYESTLKNLKVKILISSNDEMNINEVINKYIKSNLINIEDIINIQFFDMDKKKCKVIISYKD